MGNNVSMKSIIVDKNDVYVGQVTAKERRLLSRQFNVEYKGREDDLFKLKGDALAEEIKSSLEEIRANAK